MSVLVTCFPGQREPTSESGRVSWIEKIQTWELCRSQKPSACHQYRKTEKASLERGNEADAEKHKETQETETLQFQSPKLPLGPWEVRMQFNQFFVLKLVWVRVLHTQQTSLHKNMWKILVYSGSCYFLLSGNNQDYCPTNLCPRMYTAELDIKR